MTSSTMLSGGCILLFFNTLLAKGINLFTAEKWAKNISLNNNILPTGDLTARSTVLFALNKSENLSSFNPPSKILIN